MSLRRCACFVPANNLNPWDKRASAVAVLRAKNGCSGWFQGGQGSAADIMSHVPILNISPPGDPNIPAPDAQTAPGPGPIEVYTNGRFWPIQYSANGLPVGGVFPPGSYGAQMIILFHELAHKVGLIPDDWTAGSENNTQTVMKHCAGTVK
jgi:hypothetical protein